MAELVRADDWRDVLAIRDVLERYALGVDRRDWDSVGGCFAVDCAADYGPSDRWSDRAALVSALDAMHRDIGPTMHRVSNHNVSVAGDVASSVAYFDAYLKLEYRGFDLLHVVGTYHDEWQRADAGWEITARRVDTFLRRWELTRS